MTANPVKFTPAQQAAIDCDAPLILVSAAAGSGKTAVLTARIMRHLREGRGLDNLLVVTFTEAAAAGMKDKITERLHEEAGLSGVGTSTSSIRADSLGIAERISMQGTMRNLALLPTADISTIHAFCRKVVKTHFQQVGLDPAFRVGDEAELELLKGQVMEALFESEYEAAGEHDTHGFIDLADAFGGKSSDERLDALVRKVYDFLESDPFPTEAAARYTAQFTNASNLNISPYANIAREELARGLRNAAHAVTHACTLCDQPGGPFPYVDRLKADADEIRRLNDSLHKPFSELYHTARTLSFGNLARVTQKHDVDEGLKTRVQRIRNKYIKDAVKTLIGGIFFAPPEKMHADVAALAPRVAALMGLTVRFAARYATEKRTRNLLDFSDLEHFAIRILYPHGPYNMTPGPAAVALARKYHEVLIDEYQDANAVQELILSAVSARRFMVGDVKQSIYRFRRANPALFREKYENYKRWAVDGSGGERNKNTGTADGTGGGGSGNTGAVDGTGGGEFPVRQSVQRPPGELPPTDSSCDAVRYHSPIISSCGAVHYDSSIIPLCGTVHCDSSTVPSCDDVGDDSPLVSSCGTLLCDSPIVPSFDALRIDLSQNFRSRAEIIDGVNFFFSRIMSKDVGEIDYDEAAALKAGADYPPWPVGIDARVRVDLLENIGDSGDPDEIEVEMEPPLIIESRLIACRIYELINSQHPIWDASLGDWRPCRLSDMVILTRSITRVAPDIIATLKDCGIPAVAEAQAGFFDRLEIKIALAFLRVTDNPRQDIDLIAVLHSPVYGVDADELLEIRRACEDGDYYDCVEACIKQYNECKEMEDNDLKEMENNEFKEVEDNGFKEAEEAKRDSPKLKLKLTRFLTHLTLWRAAATHLPISRLLGMIYDTTRYPAHAAAMPEGEARTANLRLLLERAIAFEETRLTGLFQFTRYIQRLHETQAIDKISAANIGNTSAETASTDCVRLMTIHKSKGLEFPIVFVSFLGRRFNLADETAPVILHSEYGAGPYYTDTALRTRSNTLPRYTLARLTHRENLSEELRCLYVAMTRAMQLLILTAHTSDFTRACEKWEDAPDPTSANRYLDWLMPCILQNEDNTAIKFTLYNTNNLPTLQRNGYDTTSPQGNGHDVTNLQGNGYNVVNPQRNEYEVTNLQGNRYDVTSPQGDVFARGGDFHRAPEAKTIPLRAVAIPLQENTHTLQGNTHPLQVSNVAPIPSKLSISEIKRLYAADLTPDSTPHEPIELPPFFEPPRFIQAEKGLTAMRMGSILHTLTEHMDYHIHTTPTAIETLITDLTEKNLLTPEEAAFINRDKLLTLAASPLADRIRAAQTLHREVPFVMQLETGTLVHGIIDAYFEEDGQIVLIDFKSDHTSETTIDDLVTRHTVQLDIYKKAVASATAKSVKEVLLYSFTLGKTIAIITSP